MVSSFCWICLEFICLFGRNIHFSWCLVFDFRWLEKEIGSDIVRVMKTVSVWCMDQDVGKRRSVTVSFGILQQKVKALWGHFGTLQHGISWDHTINYFSWQHRVRRYLQAENMEFALQSSICRFETFLQNCRRGGGWAWTLADSKPCDLGLCKEDHKPYDFDGLMN